MDIQQETLHSHSHIGKYMHFAVITLFQALLYYWIQPLRGCVGSCGVAFFAVCSCLTLLSWQRRTARFSSNYPLSRVALGNVIQCLPQKHTQHVVLNNKYDRIVHISIFYPLDNKWKLTRLSNLTMLHCRLQHLNITIFEQFRFYCIFHCHALKKNMK